MWLSARNWELGRKRKDRFITKPRRLHMAINNFSSENEWWEKIHFVHFFQNDRQKNTYSNLNTIAIYDISSDFERLKSISVMLKGCHFGIEFPNSADKIFRKTLPKLQVLIIRVIQCMSTLFATSQQCICK